MKICSCVEFNVVYYHRIPLSVSGFFCFSSFSSSSSSSSSVGTLSENPLSSAELPSGVEGILVSCMIVIGASVAAAAAAMAFLAVRRSANSSRRERHSRSESENLI
jgi:hypothetical protein